MPDLRRYRKPLAAFAFGTRDSQTRSHAESAGKLVAVATATSAAACGCIEAWPSLLA
jgi:hypothetical protein